MGVTRSFLLKRVVICVLLMVSISAYSEHIDMSLDVRKPNETLPCGQVVRGLLFEKSFERFGKFFNNQKESPRQNVYSILQYLGTLSIYIGFVLIRNILHSREMFDVDTLAHQVQNSVTRKIQDCCSLQKEILYPFYKRFWGNFLDISNSVYYHLFENEHNREASFLDLKEPSPVSILNLARYGFYYLPNDQLVKCSGCGTQMRLKDFKGDPSDRQFHASTSCPFVLSASPSLYQKALRSQQGVETNGNADKSGLLTQFIIEDKANTEQTQIGYAIGGQLDESDIKSNIALPASCEDPTPLNCPETSCPYVSYEESKFGNEKVASTLQESAENRNVPVVSPPSMKEGKEEIDSTPNPSRPTSDDSHGPGSRPLSTISSSDISSSDMGQQIAMAHPSSAGFDDKCNGARPKNGSSKEERRTNSENSRAGHVKAEEFPKGKKINSLEDSRAGEPKADNFQWLDSDKFESECFSSKTEKKRHEELVSMDSCPKEEVHDSFFAVDKITKSQLPDSLQSLQFHSFLITASNLTVKLQSKSISLDRPKDGACRIKHINDAMIRYGTGCAYLDTEEDKAEASIRQIKESLPKSTTKKVKQFLSHSVGHTTKCYFSVQTTRHLVFDNSEAQHTEVLFEIQDAKHRNVKRYRGKGVFVIHDNVEGNYRTTLLCKSSDPGLLQALEKERQKFALLKRGLPQEMRSELLESCFVIAHPHGLNKTVTFGHSTIVKYALFPQGKDTAKRQFGPYIPNGKESPTQDIRELLMYTAGTCCGSSGAPVFLCRNIRQNPNEEMTTQLIVWTHNGVEKESGLNCSVMNPYQPELTEKANPPPMNKASLPAPAPTPSSSSASTAVGPQAPIYITMESRLQSFKRGYKSDCKHSPLELAEAGFYFAGYDDCIKCFCCGLGLKTWDSRNNVYEEHQRLMPDCNFLKAHKDTDKKLVPALLFDEMEENGEPVQVTLLKSERKKLTSKFICKVCWKYSSSELFLACGDVFACERCSSFLYTCPVCNKPIYATVTAFLS